MALLLGSDQLVSTIITRRSSSHFKLLTDTNHPAAAHSMEWGGSNIRPEATGYGAVYFGLEILKDRGDDIKGKRCFISGSGNVAQYAAEKLLELGAVVLTFSDSTGYIYEPEGFTSEQVKQVGFRTLGLLLVRVPWCTLYNMYEHLLATKCWAAGQLR